MILKPYPEYKESGVSWIGPIPKHWEVHPNRALFSERNIKNNNGQELLSVTIKKGVIRQVDFLLNSSKKDSSNEDKSNYKLVKPGDLVYNKMRMWQGAVGASKYKGIVSPAYIIVHPREGMDEWYYHYLFRSPLYIKESYRYSYGICDDQLSLRIDDFKKIFTPKPPLKEQKQIVRFINYKSAQISRFIRAKRRIIELLKEQKQAIINQAVTRGLDPNVKLKPSGVEWLGEIPEHWVVRYFFQYFKEKCVKNIDGREKNRLSLSYGKIIRKSIDATEGLLPTSYETYQIVSQGDIILRLTDLQNDHKSLRVGFVNETGIITSAYLCLVVITADLLPEFAALLLHVYDFKKVFYSMGGGVRQSIGFNELKRYPVLVPPVSEQVKIVQKIKIETINIDSSVERLEKEISLMREYRARLIADVVTGKVDVRDIEVPDVADEELVIEDRDEMKDAEETIEEAEDEE